MPLVAPRAHAALRALRSTSAATSAAARRPGPVPSTRVSGALPRSSSTSTSTSTPRVRKPSPYRLPTLPAFLASFAPLHAAGWRLDSIATAAGATTHSAAEDMLSGADLQGRRMVRAYAFPRDREGWRGLMALMARIGAAVEDLDVSGRRAADLGIWRSGRGPVGHEEGKERVCGKVRL